MTGVLTLEQWVVYLVVAALVLAPVAAFLIRWRYNAAVRRLMLTSGGAEVAQAPAGSSPPEDKSAQTLQIELRDVPGRVVPSSSNVRFALNYFLAGVACAIAMTVVLFLLDNMEFLPVRTLIICWVYSTLAVFSALYVAGMRHLLIVPLALLWLLCALALAVFVTGDIWSAPALAYLVLVPSAMGLLLVNRHIGTIAPLLVPPAMLVAAGVWLSLMVLVNGEAYDLGHLVWPLALLVAGAGLACAWLYLALMARQYRSGKVSELMLQNDAFWLLACANVAVNYVASKGWLALGMIIPFLVYRLVLALTARFTAAPTQRQRLLFLRVFGFQKRQAELHRVVLNTWRQSGPVALIGAPDSALDTLDPPELFAFITGRLKQVFVRDASDVEEELARPATRAADGLYQVDDFYCFEDTWQASVQSLIEASGRVVMDLRGFDRQNMGCLYEIGELFRRCTLEQLVFLADSTTDQDVLCEALRDAWSEAGRSGAGPEATLSLWIIDSAGALRGLAHQLERQLKA